MPPPTFIGKAKKIANFQNLAPGSKGVSNKDWRKYMDGFKNFPRHVSGRIFALSNVFGNPTSYRSRLGRIIGTAVLESVKNPGGGEMGE